MAATPTWLQRLFEHDLVRHDCEGNPNCNEKRCSWYCVDCCKCLCATCKDYHLRTSSLCRLIEIIKRDSDDGPITHNVLVLSQIEPNNLIPCKRISIYKDKVGRKVVYINRRKAAASAAGSAWNQCKTCGKGLGGVTIRPLPKYCCILCKTTSSPHALGAPDPWLEKLFNDDDSVIDKCEDHQCNIDPLKHLFCVHCCKHVCKLCVIANHHSCKVIEIKTRGDDEHLQYVLSLSQVDHRTEVPLIDCKYIHTPGREKQEVVYINRRKDNQASSIRCKTCGIGLRGRITSPGIWCSIYCKTHPFVAPWLEKLFINEENIKKKDDDDSFSKYKCEDHSCNELSDIGRCCTNCCKQLCDLCARTNHPSCRVIEIRKLDGRNVLLLNQVDDILISCESINTYKMPTEQGVEVVYIKREPMREGQQGSGNTCKTCGIGVQPQNEWCSVFCKINPPPYIFSSLESVSTRKRTRNSDVPKFSSIKIQD